MLEKHPSRALKCGLADWYMKQGGDENRKRALKLLEESAKEGFGWAEVGGVVGRLRRARRARPTGCSVRPEREVNASA